MPKKLLDSKLLYIVLSVIISISLWYYVTTIEGVTDTDTVNGIPVSFEGEDVLMERGLMITSETNSVNMKFQATASNLVKLKAEDAISLSLDVSSITQPGTYTMAYNVSYSGISRSNFTVMEQNPANVTFVVESRITRPVEIRGEYKGQAADGYVIELDNNNRPVFEFAPQTLKVSGLENDVNKIAYALVTVEDDGITETISREFAYELIGWDDKPLDREELAIECPTQSVTTTLRVKKHAEIPLSVELIEGGGVSIAENVEWDYSPKSITVSGETEDVQALVSRGKLKVATINLAEIEVGETVLVRTIPLAEELTNVDGVSEVTIAIKITGLVSKTLEVTEFDVQNVPSGYKAAVQNKNLSVIVRGTEEELADVTPENLRVVADLTNIDLTPGQYTVNAKIYFDGIGNAGVKGLNYPLVVRLTTTPKSSGEQTANTR